MKFHFYREVFLKREKKIGIEITTSKLRLRIENIYHCQDSIIKWSHDFQSSYIFHQKIILHGHFSDHDFSSFTKWNQKKWKIAPIQKQHSRESFLQNHGLFQIPLANPIFTFLVKPQVWKSFFLCNDAARQLNLAFVV